VGDAACEDAEGGELFGVDELGLGAAEFVEDGEELFELALGIPVELSLFEGERGLICEEGEGAEVFVSELAGAGGLVDIEGSDDAFLYAEGDGDGGGDFLLAVAVGAEVGLIV